MNIRGIALVANGVFGSDTAVQSQCRTNGQIGHQRATGIEQAQKGCRSAITGLYIAKESAEGLHRRAKGKE